MSDEEPCTCDRTVCPRALNGQCCREQLREQAIPVPSVEPSLQPADGDDVDLFPDGDPLSEDV